tara:strand:+ start:427 stop:549 length:123 start_codon:yes stop_codon:yes gene_type:complete
MPYNKKYKGEKPADFKKRVAKKGPAKAKAAKAAKTKYMKK